LTTARPEDERSWPLAGRLQVQSTACRLASVLVELISELISGD
jgi:hypothetical protein